MNKKADINYGSLLLRILDNGVSKPDRTGTGTISLFGLNAEYDLTNNKIPLLTAKKMPFMCIVHELLWMLSGDTNIGYLVKNKVKIWNEWADKAGNLGRVYGAQWRNWMGANLKDITTIGQEGVNPLEIAYFKPVDQIEQLMKGLKENPYDRGHIVSAWQPAEFDVMALRPCHTLFQFDVTPNPNGGKDRLSCQLYQRSADMFLGVPFNIVFYSLLTHMIAKVLDLEAYKFHHAIGDGHIYNNHIDQVNTLLDRNCLGEATIQKLPKLDSIFDYKPEHFLLDWYESHPAIKAEVSV